MKPEITDEWLARLEARLRQDTGWDWSPDDRAKIKAACLATDDREEAIDTVCARLKKWRNAA